MMMNNVFQVLELYPEFAESFANNLQITFSMRDVCLDILGNNRKANIISG